MFILNFEAQQVMEHGTRRHAKQRGNANELSVTAAVLHLEEVPAHVVKLSVSVFLIFRGQPDSGRFKPGIKLSSKHGAEGWAGFRTGANTVWLLLI
jgi:hypothetical protein